MFPGSYTDDVSETTELSERAAMLALSSDSDTGVLSPGLLQAERVKAEANNAINKINGFIFYQNPLKKTALTPNPGTGSPMIPEEA